VFVTILQHVSLLNQKKQAASSFQCDSCLGKAKETTIGKAILLLSKPLTFSRSMFS